eukprot:scaffold12292_cov112-Isochrysis_galbana.AAC.2
MFNPSGWRQDRNVVLCRVPPVLFDLNGAGLRRTNGGLVQRAWCSNRQFGKLPMPRRSDGDASRRERVALTVGNLPARKMQKAKQAAHRTAIFAPEYRPESPSARGSRCSSRVPRPHRGVWSETAHQIARWNNCARRRSTAVVTTEGPAPMSANVVLIVRAESTRYRPLRMCVHQPPDGRTVVSGADA